MTKKFTRHKEDFICEKCGATVTGNGYTNHCPNCLWSKHVDVHPGDRAAICKGLMEPHRIEGAGEHQKIIHRCVTCSYEKANTISPEDNFDAILLIAKTNADR